MPDLALNVVTAYYLDPAAGVPVQLLQQNSLMAADAAPNWDAFRVALVALGWEPYISPPVDPQDPRAAQGYTKGFFRTPEDQALEVAEAGDGAAPVDQSAHQAGRAFDLDLNGMSAAFPDFDYNTLAGVAAQYGFTARISGEPWHFDDNPAANPLYGSTLAAVQAIGNTSDQVAAAVAAGQPRPEQLAINGAATKSVLLVTAAIAFLWLISSASNKPKKPEAEHAAAGNSGGPDYVF